jgi:hypothetical protein
MDPNDRQVGGNHYQKTEGEQHWDRAWRLKYDPFQYIITKWVERWRDKGGVEDLRKAQHAIEKYISVVAAQGKAELPTRIEQLGTMVNEGSFDRFNDKFRCVRCGDTVLATSVQFAQKHHGECAGEGYVAQ